MRMLAFDTCLDKTYVTYTDGKNFLNKVIVSNEKNYHSAYLISTIVELLKAEGLDGKVILAHCLNESAAKKLKNMIEAELPGATVKIGINLGLCSYYAEKGGLLVGFEKT